MKKKETKCVIELTDAELGLKILADPFPHSPLRSIRLSAFLSAFNCASKFELGLSGCIFVIFAETTLHLDHLFAEIPLLVL